MIKVIRVFDSFSGDTRSKQITFTFEEHSIAFSSLQCFHSIENVANLKSFLLCSHCVLDLWCNDSFIRVKIDIYSLKSIANDAMN